MKKYTIGDLKEFKVVKGLIQCPKGDYTKIKVFNSPCAFKEYCIFSYGSVFDESCEFGPRCWLGDRYLFTNIDYLMKIAHLGKITYSPNYTSLTSRINK